MEDFMTQALERPTGGVTLDAIWDFLAKIDAEIQDLRTQASDDETAYLFSTPANKKRLLEAKANFEQNTDIVTIPVEQFFA
jgi:hypothetical protein